MIIKRIAAIGAAGALALALAACGSSTTASTSSSSTAAMTSAMSSSMMTSGMMSSGMMSSAPMSSGGMTSGGSTASGLVGAGCAAYAKAVPSGAGSVEGMSADPVATAASNNPLLKTLVAAVSGKLNPKVDLVSTLNSGEFTVFAPVDEAFAKLPAATVETLKTDDALLKKILTYHVIAGQLDASQVVGTHKTVEGGEVTVTGSGDSLKVNDSTVICGNVKTKNATVYLIDTVLTPSAATAGSGSAMPSASGMTSSSAMASGSAAGASLVGPGCAEYAKTVPTGAGSVEGMSADPVATAASNNPLLKTLVAAVSGQLNPKVNLVSTLNSDQFTVFAPVDSAFAKLPAATVETLKKDDALLKKILTYHVIAGQLDPSQIVGTHKTIEGASVTVTGSGDNLMVDKAKVVCGGVKTKNATVYLIDTVLTPAS